MKKLNQNFIKNSSKNKKNKKIINQIKKRNKINNKRI